MNIITLTTSWLYQ